MTEEQKQDLIERLIKFRGGVMSARDAGMATRDDEMDDRIAEIALAALTAQPVKQPQRYDAHGFNEPAHILNSRWIEAIRAAGYQVEGSDGKAE